MLLTLWIRKMNGWGWCWLLLLMRQIVQAMIKVKGKIFMKKRIRYAIITLILLVAEVLIALFIHDKFIRPYVGDVLVTVLICTFLRILLPEKVKLLPLYVFLFAALVEVAQYFEIVKLIGLEKNKFFSILIGSVFDIKDIICYGIGCILVYVIEKHIADKA